MPKYRSSQHCGGVFPPLCFFQLLFGASRLRPHASLLPSASLLIFALCFVMALVCFSSAAYGQSSTATLSGTVQDRNGAYVANANIALINSQQATKRLTTTNSEGAFIFVLLPPGRYLVTKLVPIDALLEFKSQTSTYAPGFDRMPGGRVSIVTRSGSNDFHGTRFDYFRNDVLDGTDWFTNANCEFAKTARRENDFGAVITAPNVEESFVVVLLRPASYSLTATPDGLAPVEDKRPGATEFEDRVAKIERGLIRIFALVMLLLALLAVFIYASVEFVKFVTHLPNSKGGG